MKPKKKDKPLSNARGYESFVKSRDQVLESVLRKYQRALDRTIDYLVERVTEIVSASHIASHDLHLLKCSLSHLEHKLDREFDVVERDVTVLLYRMRGTVFGLSHLGQTVAICGAQGKDAQYDLTRHRLSEIINQDMRAGGPVEHRAWLAFESMKRKIVDAYQRGILMDDSTQDILDRVLTVFPKPKTFKRVPKELKHPTFTEAGDTALAITKKAGVVTGMIDPELWSQMVEDYTKEEIPFYPARQPMSEEKYYEEHGKYEWEVEQQATQEFVDQVRQGEITAANDNGITDFVWLAVIDGHTDECCTVRDGLTTAEIEEGLKSGSIDSEECDAVTPPAHFNCRCRVVPMTDEIAAQVPTEDGDFETWLNERI